MYLHKRHYVGNRYRDTDKQVRVVVPKNQEGVIAPTGRIDNARISRITEEVACWRKANQIHKWFVDNVQDGNDDCKEYYVSRDQLKELLSLCEQVLKASKLVDRKIENGSQYRNGKCTPNIEDGKTIEDPTIAKRLLPTQEGFFFGGQEYDQYYFEDIECTVQALEKILKEENGDFYYDSSW